MRIKAGGMVVPRLRAILPATTTETNSRVQTGTLTGTRRRTHGVKRVLSLTKIVFPSILTPQFGLTINEIVGVQQMTESLNQKILTSFWVPDGLIR